MVIAPASCAHSLIEAAFDRDFSAREVMSRSSDVSRLARSAFSSRCPCNLDVPAMNTMSSIIHDTAALEGRAADSAGR